MRRHACLLAVPFLLCGLLAAFRGATPAAGALRAQAQSGQAQTSQAQASEAQPPAIIKSDVDLVSIYFTVRGPHRELLPDLQQNQFRVLEDGRPQAIKFFAHHSDVPLNVGVLLDVGTSVPRTLALEADASSLFFERVVRPKDLGFLVSYAGHVETVQLPTADVGLLQEQARTIRRTGSMDESAPVSRGPVISLPGGGAPLPIPMPQREAHLYDAVRVSTFRYLKHESGRKALLILALSDDQHSESSLEDALIALQQSDVIAYVIQMQDGDHDNCDVRHIFSEGRLKRLAEETGGRMIEVRGMDKMGAAFTEISDELHNQYSLGYYPQNAKWDGKFRKVQIVADQRDARVIARKGYYAIPVSER